MVPRMVRSLATLIMVALAALMVVPTSMAQPQTCSGTLNIPGAPRASNGAAAASIYITYPDSGVPGTMVLTGSSGFSESAKQLKDSEGAGGMALYANDYDAPFGPITLYFDQAGTLSKGDAFFRYPGDDTMNWFRLNDIVVTCGSPPPATSSPDPPATTQDVLHPKDANADCHIQFNEYSQARAAVLQSGGTFDDYSKARAAVLSGAYYDQMFPAKYHCSGHS